MKDIKDLDKTDSNELKIKENKQENENLDLEKPQEDITNNNKENNISEKIKSNENVESVEIIQRKIDEENEEYEEKRLVKISELQSRKKPFSDFYLSTVILFTIFAFLFFIFFTLKQNPINVALKFKDMTVSNKTYIALEQDLKKIKGELTKEELVSFTTDVLILSRYAKENDITIDNKDIEEIEKLGFSVLKEEIALSKKLKNSFQKIADNFTEEDYIKHYEDTKDPYYRKNGNISYYYFHSDKDLFEDTPLDKSKLELRSGTLEELNLAGITDFTEGIIQYLWPNEDETRQYIYIEDANMEYYSYEDVKEEVIKNLKHITVDGKLSEITFLEKERYVIETFEDK